MPTKKGLASEFAEEAKAQQEKPLKRGKSDDPIESWGVGLKASEWREIEKIAQELGEKSRHKIAAYGLRYFLKAYRAGDIKPEKKQTQTLPGL